MGCPSLSLLTQDRMPSVWNFTEMSSKVTFFSKSWGNRNWAIRSLRYHSTATGSARGPRTLSGSKNFQSYLRPPEMFHETKNDNVSSQPKFSTSLPWRQFPRIIFYTLRHNYAVVSHKSRNVCCVAPNHHNICISEKQRYQDYSERGNWTWECSIGSSATEIYWWYAIFMARDRIKIFTAVINFFVEFFKHPPSNTGKNLQFPR